MNIVYKMILASASAFFASVSSSYCSSDEYQSGLEQNEGNTNIALNAVLAALALASGAESTALTVMQTIDPNKAFGRPAHVRKLNPGKEPSEDAVQAVNNAKEAINFTSESLPVLEQFVREVREFAKNNEVQVANLSLCLRNDEAIAYEDWVINEVNRIIQIGNDIIQAANEAIQATKELAAIAEEYGWSWSFDAWDWEVYPDA
ncbi:MAG: hypothetical protein LBQ43_00865 [Holosporales bacterium]|jgi:hypothetical protein|nr:hypothetical protein [Holosporales bacterium]